VVGLLALEQRLDLLAHLGRRGAVGVDVEAPRTRSASCWESRGANCAYMRSVVPTKTFS
jgi:hypothetical protein